MFAFVVSGLFLCTQDDVNHNNTVTDLGLTHLAIFFAGGVHSEAADWYFNHLSHVAHVASFYTLVDFHLNWCWVPHGRPLCVDFLRLLSVFAECYTANGEDYRGFQNQTSLHGGKHCLFWNETFQHPYNTLKYPNGEGGLGSHNYCRWVRHCGINTPSVSLCCPKDKLTGYLKCGSQCFCSPAFISIKLMSGFDWWNVCGIINQRFDSPEIPLSPPSNSAIWLTFVTAQMLCFECFIDGVQTNILCSHCRDANMLEEFA